MVLDNLVNESYEYLIECQNYMHELDMKMIKCEHHCIVNEDSNMMILAEEEYKNKLAEIIKAIWQKIIIFIHKIIIKIKKDYNKFKKMFSNIKEKIKNLFVRKEASYEYHKRNSPKTLEIGGSVLDIIKNKSREFNGKYLRKWIVGLQYAIDESDEASYQEQVKEILHDIRHFKDGDNETVTAEVTPELANNAVNIIDDFSTNWVSQLEHAKAYFKKMESGLPITNAFRKRAMYCQSIINQCIMIIQQILSVCFKICYIIDGGDEQKTKSTGYKHEIFVLEKQITSTTNNNSNIKFIYDEIKNKVIPLEKKIEEDKDAEEYIKQVKILKQKCNAAFYNAFSKLIFERKDKQNFNNLSAERKQDFKESLLDILEPYENEPEVIGTHICTRLRNVINSLH